MEYHINIHKNISDNLLRKVESVLMDEDPSAIIDFDGKQIRISTYLSIKYLENIISNITTMSFKITQIPSTCCGSCSG